MYKGAYGIGPVPGSNSKVRVSGWAYNIHDDTDKVTVKIFQGRRLLTACTSDSYDPKFIENLSVKDGCCGFIADVDVNSDFGSENTLSVRVLGDYKELPILSPRPYINYFYFIHIPKTAGTTLRKILESRIEPHLVLPDDYSIQRFQGLYPPVKFLKRYDSREIQRYVFFRGHYHYDYISLMPRPCKSITILREPLGRAISHIQMMIRDNPLYKGMTLDEFVHKNCQSINNFQTRFFARTVLDQSQETFGLDFIETKFALHNSDIESAKNNLKKIDYVGIQSDLPSLIKKIIPSYDVSQMSKENAFSYSTELGADSLQRLKDNLAFDFELFELAKGLAEERDDGERP